MDIDHLPSVFIAGPFKGFRWKNYRVIFQDFPSPIPVWQGIIPVNWQGNPVTIDKEINEILYLSPVFRAELFKFHVKRFHGLLQVQENGTL